MDYSNLLTLALLFALFLIVLFVIRELVLWYYKINERVELQRQALEILVEIRSLLDAQNKKKETGNSLNNPEVMSKLEQHVKDKG